MKIQSLLVWGIVLLQVMAVAGSGLAAPRRVAIDLTGLASSDFQLQAALYDNSGITGDSWVLMDNFVLGPALDDFETGALGSFDASLNPGSVAANAGALNGTGNYVMRIDEDPVFTPTYAFRDYLSPVGSVLTFDLDMVASDVAGSFGFDELVISLLDPVTLEPLVPGLNGFGDVLSLSAAGLFYSSEVSVPLVPAPAALGLVLLGTGVLRSRRNL